MMPEPPEPLCKLENIVKIKKKTPRCDQLKGRGMLKESLKNMVALITERDLSSINKALYGTKM